VFVSESDKRPPPKNKRGKLFETPFSKRWHRKKRSHDGVSWKPPTLQDKESGVWCRRCKIRHPYNGKNRLLTSYQFAQDGSPEALLWLCPRSGDVIGTLRLGK
jgi:hypothetical protein